MTRRHQHKQEVWVGLRCDEQKLRSSRQHLHFRTTITLCSTSQQQTMLGKKHGPQNTAVYSVKKNTSGTGPPMFKRHEQENKLPQHAVTKEAMHVPPRSLFSIKSVVICYDSNTRVLATSRSTPSLVFLPRSIVCSDGWRWIAPETASAPPSFRWL